MNAISRMVPWVAGLMVASALAQDPAPPAGGGEGRPRREGREGGGREGGGREGGGREGGMRGGPGMMSPVVQALDTDGDGELSAAEIANASVSLKKLDKNGDGKIDREEMRPAFGPGQRRGPGAGAGADTAERLTQLMSYDKNGDGKLVASELPERMQAMIERADADKDGSVTRAELEAFLNRQGGGRGPGGGGPGGQGGPGGPGGGEGGGRRRPGGE